MNKKRLITLSFAAALFVATGCIEMSKLPEEGYTCGMAKEAGQDSVSKFMACGEDSESNPLYCVNGQCINQEKAKIKLDVEGGELWCQDDLHCLEKQKCIDVICRYTCPCPAGYQCGAGDVCYKRTENDGGLDDDDIFDGGGLDDDDDDAECRVASDCKFPNAFAECRQGTCVMTRCKPGYRDTNGVMADGCEYMCTQEERGAVEICDGIDNDCDGAVDNVSPKPSTIEHCGACFNTCELAPNSQPVCEDYQCKLNCNPGFANVDGKYETGCEEGSCTPTNGGVEICDGKDNDCNGIVDDGDLCPQGQVCMGGKCVDKCSDKCYPPNSKGCEGNKVVTCMDGNGDGCLDFVVTETCGSGKTCDAGRCVEGCSDECETTGQKTCDGNDVLTCGNYDDDVCLEWGDARPCGPGKQCRSGACVDACSDKCLKEGDTKCEGGKLLTCEYADDGCLDWSAPANCPSGQVCEDGVCKAPACSDKCSKKGDVMCNGMLAMVCDTDKDGCLDWAISENCKDTLRICDANLGKCASGCADGYPEGISDNGKMFACKGAWTVPGLDQVDANKRPKPACGRKAGDDFADSSGKGCNVEDLCAEGYHVCLDKDEVAQHGDCNLTSLEDGFWVTRQYAANSGTGNYTINCLPDPVSHNNFFGCVQGDVGRSPGNNSCLPLNGVTENACAGTMERDTWYCPDAEKERDVLVHGNGPGGVLCCINK